MINIKTKEPTFDEWLEDVQKSSPHTKQATKACLFWINEDEKYEQADWAYLNMQTEDLEYLHKSLSDVIFQRKLHDFMKDNIGEYVEYIE